MLVVLTALSMFYGNLVAIPQRNIKRMLAYSSIAQVGYLMIGVLTAMHVFTVPAVSTPVRGHPERGGARGYRRHGHAAVGHAGRADLRSRVSVHEPRGVRGGGCGRQAGSGRMRSTSYAGLMKRSPFFAAALTVFLVSLAGVPPTAGFLGKFFIFGGAIRSGSRGIPS